MKYSCSRPTQVPGIVEHLGPVVGRVRLTGGKVDFTQHDEGILATSVRVEADGFEDTV
jgi:hypothetical protein